MCLKRGKNDKQKGKENRMKKLDNQKKTMTRERKDLNHRRLKEEGDTGDFGRTSSSGSLSSSL